MEQNNEKVIRRRRSHAEILNLLSEYSKTNETVKQFCITHNINKASFHKWQSRYKTQRPITGFVPVQVSSSSRTVGLFAEVNSIKIYQPVSAAYLKELLA